MHRNSKLEGPRKGSKTWENYYYYFFKRIQQRGKKVYLQRRREDPKKTFKKTVKKNNHSKGRNRPLERKTVRRAKRYSDGEREPS